VGENLPVQPVDQGKIGHIRQKDGRFDNLCDSSTCSSQDCLQIGQHLAGLCFNTFCQLTGRRV
jgi:hypothetical protein